MRIHPITGMPLEDGHGAHPEHVQVALHCLSIEAAGDKARADALRKELGIPTAEERAAATAENGKEHSDLNARLAKLEKDFAAHVAETGEKHAEHGGLIEELIARLGQHKAGGDAVH